MRAVVTARILRGAMAALARHGLDATVDDVAAEAGVSRRTVFRHFASQGELFVAAINEIFEVYDRNLPRPPEPETPLDTWLFEAATTYHELNARLVGRAFWDIHIQRPGVAPEVLAALADVSTRRYGWATQVATDALHKAGGSGAPPAWVVDAFALHLSAFATFAIANHTPEHAGRVCSQVLSAVLAAVVPGTLHG
jgi:AcrR family transcriptional regulator